MEQMLLLESQTRRHVTVKTDFAFIPMATWFDTLDQKQPIQRFFLALKDFKGSSLPLLFPPR